jgi:hypothetical protein
MEREITIFPDSDLHNVELLLEVGDFLKRIKKAQGQEHTIAHQLLTTWKIEAYHLILNS